ncbi:hypothetical protein P43SY_009839 [Pythium insidiosum]|uniref:protein-tyrosine-phosphatase n=1 Tax=Pythium insidiosum TaxID=114742 RepID=A0AAD5LVZ8_PYTIN|nr:hypothetical protein P43SY_009839 [Pythium insidiosum]
MPLFLASQERRRDVVEVCQAREDAVPACAERTPVVAAKTGVLEPVRTTPHSLPALAVVEKPAARTTAEPETLRAPGPRRAIARARACRVGSLLARFDEESDSGGSNGSGSGPDRRRGDSAAGSLADRPQPSRKRAAQEDAQDHADATSTAARPADDEPRSTSSAEIPDSDENETLVIRKRWKRRLEESSSQAAPSAPSAAVTPTLVRSLSSQSMLLERPKLAVERPSASATPSAAADKLHELVLPTIRSSKHPDLNVISPHTVAELLNGTYADRLDSFVLIDCRFGYEHEGGHLKELYLIDGGYKNCFETLKGEMCDPAEYLPMNHPSYADQCKRDFAALRTQATKQSKTGTFATCWSFRPIPLHCVLSPNSFEDGLPFQPLGL